MLHKNLSTDVSQSESEETEVEECLSTVLPFFNPEHQASSAKPDNLDLPSTSNQSFRYNIKRISQLDNHYTRFTTGIIYKFVSLRKVLLKLAELSESLGSIAYGSPPIYSSQAVPTFQSWTFIVLKILEDIHQSVNSRYINPQDAKDGSKEISRVVRRILCTLEEQVYTLQKRFRRFVHNFSKFEKNLTKMQQKILKRLSSTASANFPRRLRDAFTGIQDIDIAKTTNILSPMASNETHGYEAECIEIHQFLIYEQKQPILLKTRVEKTNKALQANFAGIGSTEKVEVLKSLLNNFRYYLYDMNYLVLECLAPFSLKSTPKYGGRAYWEVQLEEIEKSGKQLDKCFPAEQARCLELVSQTMSTINSIRLIVQPLETFIQCVERIWMDIFGRRQFFLDQFNFPRATSILEGWSSLCSEKSATFDITYRPQREYWCNHIIAPPHNELANPLMFHLVENALTGIIDFHSEYQFRLQRMNSSLCVVYDDVESSSALLQQIFLNATLLIKQFRHLHQEIRKPFHWKFGRIIDEEKLHQNSQNELKRVAFNCDERALNYWIILLAQSYQICWASKIPAKLNYLEQCHKLLTNYIKKLVKIYNMVQNKLLLSICEMVQQFEKLKAASTEVSSLHDYKLIEIKVDDNLPPFSPAHHSETGKTFGTDITKSLPNIGEMILLKASASNLSFTFADGKKLNYSSMNQEYRFLVFQSLLNTAMNLISTKMQFFEKNKKFLYKNETKNGSGQYSNQYKDYKTLYIGSLVKETQQLSRKCQRLNGLEILIGLRSLRYLKQEIEYFQCALFHEISSCQLGNRNFQWILKLFSKGKLTTFDYFAAGTRKALCFHDKALAKELLVSAINAKIETAAKHIGTGQLVPAEYEAS